MENEMQVLNTESMNTQVATIKAEVDIIVATAKRYPRDLSKSIENAVMQITLDPETAESAGYQLKRGGKVITGKSINLATIAAMNYKNLRVGAYIKSIEDKRVVAVGMCYDAENNFGQTLEVSRSIWSKKQGRYSEDMINMTTLAAISIARRNAILSVIPKAFTDKMYNAAMDTLKGELKDDRVLKTRRTKMFNFFKKEYKIEKDVILNYLDVQDIEDIDAEQMLHMTQLVEGIKSGEVDVMEEFGLRKSVSEKAAADKLFTGKGNTTKKEKDDDGSKTVLERDDTTTTEPQKESKGEIDFDKYKDSPEGE